METNIYCKPEEEIIDFLKSNQIEYTQIKHTALFTMDEYENIQKKLNCLIPKNLFLCNRQKTKFYLLLMPGNKKFLTKELSSQINSARLSFAEEEKLKETLNCYKGSTSPLGLLFDKMERRIFRIPSLRQHINPENKKRRLHTLFEYYPQTLYFCHPERRMTLQVTKLPFPTKLCYSEPIKNQ